MSQEISWTKEFHGLLHLGPAYPNGPKSTVGRIGENWELTCYNVPGKTVFESPDFVFPTKEDARKAGEDWVFKTILPQKPELTFKGASDKIVAAFGGNKKRVQSLGNQDLISADRSITAHIFDMNSNDLRRLADILDSIRK